jgi:hypothetical protein
MAFDLGCTALDLSKLPDSDVPVFLTVGLWSVPAQTYLSLGSREPVVARVMAELSGNYYGAFSDSGRMWQASLEQTWTSGQRRRFDHTIERGSEWLRISQAVTLKRDRHVHR